MTTTYLLAPIRGLTDLVYRNAVAQCFDGLNGAIVPFVQTVGGNQVKATHLTECTPDQNQLPTIPQIIGKQPEQFVELARQLAEVGNQQVNWNLGCPYPTMTKKQCGAGLLPYPDRIDAFLDTVCSQLSLKISVKLRLGLESKDEILALLPILNRYPLEHVTIHPRLAQQMYEGEVDLECFAQCSDELTAPVIYNGEIHTLDDLHRLQDRFPHVQGWMLGRGLLANPFLLEELKTGVSLTAAQKNKRIEAFHTVLLKDYGQRLSGQTHQIQRLQGHWEYLAQAVDCDERLIRKLQKVKTMDAYQTVITRIFTGYIPGLPPRKERPWLKGHNDA